MDGWSEGGMERGRESLPSFFFGSTWSQTQGPGSLSIYISFHLALCPALELTCSLYCCILFISVVGDGGM